MSRAAATAPGVVVMDPRAETLQRRVVLILTIVPFAGFLVAGWTLWGGGLGPSDAIIALAFYVTTGLGVTVGYHRLFTHQSFEATRPLKVALAVLGSMAVQGSVISWVATHRRHHAFADRDGDPHSPHLEEATGVKGTLSGLWHAHVGWLASPEKTEARRWAPDLLRDPDLVAIDRRFGTLTFASFVLPAVIGGLVTQSLGGAVTAFLWGSLARIFFLHHVTWSINSICHFYGKRPFETPDLSTNNWVLAVISFGESWHNNHHAFPTAAVHGIGRGQVDPSGAVIRALRAVGLARRVKMATPKQVERKLVGELRPRPTAIAPE